MWTRTLIAGGVWIALAATAIAQDDIANFFASGSFELRAGPMYHGLEADDRLMDTLAQQRLEDINVELIWTPPPNDVLFWLGSPRAAIGATLNLRGFEHNFHANLNWHLQIFDTPFWVEGGLGGAYLTGYLHNPPPGYRALGCNTTFYTQASAGMDIGEDWTASVSWEHSSHLWKCGPDNDGLNSLGVKLGYKF